MTQPPSFESELYQPPFPWFGGKSRVAHIVWERFGDVPNYVEPFFGSGAVLFNRPHWPFDNRIETINDKDGYVANFWRALKNDPAGVAGHADWPQNENDLHARHWWLKQQYDSLHARLEGDPDFYDVKIAGWWVWGICLWIGGGFCDINTNGPWRVVDRQLIHLGDGRGIKRQLIHLGGGGQGINRKLIHLGDSGQGINHLRQPIYNYFETIADRLRRVRVCSGDWARVCGPTPTYKLGLTGIFLDPPYSTDAGHDNKLYATEDTEVSHAVREWAIANGDNSLLRIALCGYESEHSHLMPDGWECVAWKASGGYSNQNAKGNDNPTKERIWFSPHCLRPEQQLQQLEINFSDNN